MRRPAITFAPYRRPAPAPVAALRRPDRWLLGAAAAYVALNVVCVLGADAGGLFETLAFFGLVGPFVGLIFVGGAQISHRPRPFHWASLALFITFLAAAALVNLKLLGEATASV